MRVSTKAVAALLAASGVKGSFMGQIKDYFTSGYESFLDTVVQEEEWLLNRFGNKEQLIFHDAEEGFS